MNINTAIGKIIDSLDNGFLRILIRIECPLDTGVCVRCKVYTQEKEEYITPACGSRPFFIFAKEEKMSKKKLFNIISITVQPNGVWHAEYSYDNILQRKAQDMTK